jgi:hypothetical protein
MPVPPFTSSAVWCGAVEHALRRRPNADALDRHELPADVVRVIATAEADAADARGYSTLTVHELSATTGVDERTVRLVRAALSNSGLLTILSVDPSAVQLQHPRGFGDDTTPD